MSLSDELAKLHLLHQQGGLTDEEFRQAKQRLIR
ncbi:SHOCT domain-containing protein, partial [Acinetobacter baumannii]